MQYEFAPLEGITGYIYRNAHHACFPSMDRYYTPFITPKKGKSFTTREWNDIAAEHNQNIAVVPQILTNQAEGFCKVAGMLKEQGYEEVNLNLGCPSATVTAKKKGAGFLADPDALEAFLEEIFAHSPLKISIKTRIGVENPDEFERLLDIFSQYPIQKLIVHPRVLKEFYKGNVCAGERKAECSFSRCRNCGTDHSGLLQRRFIQRFQCREIFGGVSGCG